MTTAPTNALPKFTKTAVPVLSVTYDVADVLIIRTPGINISVVSSMSSFGVLFPFGATSEGFLRVSSRVAAHGVAVWYLSIERILYASRICIVLVDLFRVDFCVVNVATGFSCGMAVVPLL